MNLKNLAKLCGVELPNYRKDIISGTILSIGIYKGFNQAKEQYDDLNLDLSKALDVEKLKEICDDVGALCEVCEGSGFTGYAKSGKKISCENCGGHEDALGKGYNFDNLSQAIIKNIEGCLKEVE